MKIRQKITLWISGTALLAAVAVSAFVFLELIEEPVRLIDRELQYMADSLFEQGQDDTITPWSLDVARLPFSPDRYWIRISDQEKNILYESALTLFAEIPSREKKHYNVEMVIPREKIRIGQDDENEVLFRVRVFKRELGGRLVTIRMAKPIEELEEELLEVLRELAVGMMLCTLIIVAISYKLAGRILYPLVAINHLVREIREKSLNRRIPVGKKRDELGTLAISLNEMFDRLQYSFQRQKEFVGSASHELKSPITLLMITQEELLMHSDLSGEMREDMERQLYTMRRMSKLIRNLLDLSRLEQNERLTLGSFDLGALIGLVLEDYRDMLAAAKIVVETDFPSELPMQGDYEKLQRLLINLIDNAIRYNDAENGRLLIMGQRENDHISLVVANTGQTIPPADCERVFEQFYRVEKSRSAFYGGSGLGLTIARKIVDLHGGIIVICSDKEGWTRVTVSLPVRDG